MVVGASEKMHLVAGVSCKRCKWRLYGSVTNSNNNVARYALCRFRLQGMLRTLYVLANFKIDTSTLYKILKKTHFIWKK